MIAVGASARTECGDMGSPRRAVPSEGHVQPRSKERAALEWRCPLGGRGSLRFQFFSGCLGDSVWHAVWTPSYPGSPAWAHQVWEGSKGRKAETRKPWN